MNGPGQYRLTSGPTVFTRWLGTSSNIADRIVDHPRPPPRTLSDRAIVQSATPEVRRRPGLRLRCVNDLWGLRPTPPPQDTHIKAHSRRMRP